MKLRPFFLLGTLLIQMQTVRAQDNTYVGLDAGVGVGTIILNSLGTYRYEAAYFAGFCYEYDLSEKVSLIVRPSWSKKGAAARITFTDLAGKVTEEEILHQRFHYLTLPVQFKFHLSGQKVRPYLSIGPYSGYLLRQTSYMAATSRSDAFSTNYTEGYNRLDIGLSGSLGLTFPLGSNLSLNTEIAITQSLFPVAHKKHHFENLLFAGYLVVGCRYRISN